MTLLAEIFFNLLLRIPTVELLHDVAEDKLS